MVYCHSGGYSVVITLFTATLVIACYLRRFAVAFSAALASCIQDICTHHIGTVCSHTIINLVHIISSFLAS